MEQYDGLLAASLSATIISLMASFAGLVVHFLLLWYDRNRPANENYMTATTSNVTAREGSSSSANRYNPNITRQSRFANAVEANQDRNRGNVSRKGSSSGTMNRVSLRLIVLACISYSIYSISQLVVTGIAENKLACRVLAYFIICFDVMGSLFLGLVGFNLVLVFVVNVKHPERFEKYYYVVTVMVSIFVFIPPLVLKAGRTIDKNDSCWYHFFFEGRAANPFNWLYYYSWLLFASILAAVSSIIAIRKVILEKNNFAHTINMLNREEAFYPRPGMYPVGSSASTHFQRNTNRHATTIHDPQQSLAYPKSNTEKNSDLFRRVAIRCICYALVPVLCKSWGIGIEIAITSGIVVNYPILVIDRFMACIMGFFVSCIYFSDPSVRMVWHDMMIDYKKRYVDQLYYVDITKVIQPERAPSSYHSPADAHHHETTERTQYDKTKIANRATGSQQTVYTIINFSSATSKRAKTNSVPDPVYIYDSALRRPMKYNPSSSILYNLITHRKHCHEQATSEKQSTSHDGWLNCFLRPLQYMKRKEKSIKWVPIRRIDAPLHLPQKRIIPDDAHSADSQQSDMSMRIFGLWNETHSRDANYMNDKSSAINDYKRSKTRLFEPYSHPKLAKLIYWFYVNILFYRPPYYYRHKHAFERRKKRAKAKIRQQESSSRDFPADISSVESLSRSSDDNIDDEDRAADESYTADDGPRKHDNVIEGTSPISFVNRKNSTLSASPSSLPQEYNAMIQPKFIPNQQNTNPRGQQAIAKNENGVIVPKSPPITAAISPASSYSHNNHSPENLARTRQQPQRPLLRPGSRNRPMSSSLIQSHQENESQVKKNIPQEVVTGRSSSYPSSTVVNIPAVPSSSRLSSNVIADLPSTQQAKTKSSSPYGKEATRHSAEKGKGFLDQKPSHERLYENSKYRHIPTIGHLVQSVSPVHSFMSVRRGAASSFAQTPATRPSSLISGSSSLHSSPAAASSQSLSSSPLSSSSTTPLKQDMKGRTTSGEKRDAFALYQNQRECTMKSVWNEGKSAEEHDKICDKKSVTNDMELSMAGIDDYQQAHLDPSPLSPEERTTFQTCISGQYQQQPFFKERGGLSPPSKQHYAFIYCQGERTPTFEKVSTAMEKSSNHQASSTRKGSNFNEQGKNNIRDSSSLPATSNDYQESRDLDKPSLTKTNMHDAQASSDTDKEILFNGVRTTVVYIKNSMDIDDEIPINKLQQKKGNRIDMLIDNWKIASTQSSH